MKTPGDVVTDFLKMWNEPGGFTRSIDACFTETTVYENVGFSTTTGIAQGMAIAEQFAAMTGGGTLSVETLTQATTGNRVLNERIDHMVHADGRTLFSIRVMGIFEVEGDRIAAWRDYFDTAGMAKSMAAAG